ncbi:Ketopantoate reductase ApbA/PanE domain-containing protein [Crenothrix polyspora]|uniref:Ketopantoate reductase ApbA/PanE domain-containing protein n=1 Tax=Crenothrix polyspora TaxID=360316 RepID=A0A1R4HAE1_9GAMM|nr:SDR family oxidoreductase [Crenothrix polyspora]SJM93179.1 Ketopantoate reductase ApbA/PanE domain-containing protein [Crenothrix polyspora]
MAKILIIGCGAIGYQLAKTLADAGHNVTGLKRNPPPTHPENFKFIRADITSPTDLQALDNDFEHIFFIVSADGRNESSYHDVYQTGLNNLFERFAHIHCTAPWIFVSSTSVYGQTQGEWVDENSPTLPDKTTSLKIVNAEQKLMAHNPANVIVRFSGIYGPGREYLLRSAQQTPSIQQQPPYYTNRIHQRDCVNVLAFLLAQRLAGVKLEQCYLASDNDPAPMWDVITWMTDKLNCTPPTVKITAADCDMNKRCRNNRLKNLGYKFIYPDFKTGYLELIEPNYR